MSGELEFVLFLMLSVAILFGISIGQNNPKVKP